MHPCPSCKRHVRALETSCPFCGTKTQSLGKMARTVVGAGVTAVVLAACYGVGPDFVIDTNAPDTNDSSLLDLDDDGYIGANDCDDTDETIHPGADEICDDGIDQNCNDEVDEGCEG